MPEQIDAQVIHRSAEVYSCDEVQMVTKFVVPNRLRFRNPDSELSKIIYRCTHYDDRKYRHSESDIDAKAVFALMYRKSYSCMNAKKSSLNVYIRFTHLSVP